MLRLNLSMADKYDIELHRPALASCVLFGAGRLMLGGVARLLDRAHIGAIMLSSAAPLLREQDCMFTLLERGETKDGSPLSRELVVQSILNAIDPKIEAEACAHAAHSAELECILFPAECHMLDIAHLASFLAARYRCQASPLHILCVGDAPENHVAEALREAVLRLSSGEDAQGFAAWLAACSFARMIVDTICGQMSREERALCERRMNYADSFIGWAEPTLHCAIEGDVPACLRRVTTTDFDALMLRKLRIQESLAALIAPVGFLCAKDTLHDFMCDELLRKWLGETFLHELLSELPGRREALAPDAIEAFTRYQNALNSVPLTDLMRGLMRNYPRTLLPTMRSHAQRDADTPKGLALAFAAAIMLESGARQDAQGAFIVRRGDSNYPLLDDPSILAAFSTLAHDMPADTLAYAALANRELWGEDLREIDGLEERVTSALSCIQRLGCYAAVRECLAS